MWGRDNSSRSAQHRFRRAIAVVALGASALMLTPRRAEASAGTAAIIVSGAVAIAGLVVFAITRDKDVLEQTSSNENSSQIVQRRAQLTNTPARAGLPAVKVGPKNPAAAALAAPTRLFDVGPGVAIAKGRLMGQVVRDESGRVDGYVARYTIEF